jgi:hypothetical protein
MTDTPSPPFRDFARKWENRAKYLERQNAKYAETVKVIVLHLDAVADALDDLYAQMTTSTETTRSQLDFVEIEGTDDHPS